MGLRFWSNVGHLCTISLSAVIQIVMRTCQDYNKLWWWSPWMYFRDVVARLTQNNGKDKRKKIKRYITMSGALLTIWRNQLFKNYDSISKIMTFFSIKNSLVRQQVLQCFVNLVLKYGYKTWALNKTIAKKLEAFEMVPHLMDWESQKKRNKKSREKTLTNKIKRRLISFVGHITRKSELELHVLLFAPRKAYPERPRTNFLGFWLEWTIRTYKNGL